MFFEKCFLHFPVFGGGENNSQPENNFRLTKNALVNFEK
jgi:hypothetical protein